MTPLDDLLAWCVELKRHEHANALRPGRALLSRRWAEDAHLACIVGMARAERLAAMAPWSWAVEQLRTALNVGHVQVYGLPIELVEDCEPPLRYLPRRDPLLFGASS